MDVSVKLKLAKNQPLGIGFCQLERPPHCQVARLLETGAAKESGEIYEGDLLVGLNGKDVQHLSPEEVKELLMSLVGAPEITLDLRRTAVNGTQMSLKVVNGPSVGVTLPSPESSPRGHRRGMMMQRPRRQGVIAGLGDHSRLSEIEEGRPMQSGALNPTPLDKKRFSLTPETTRKQPPAQKSHLRVAKSLDLSNLPQWRQQATQMVPLKNLQEGTELHDRLHNQQIKVGGARHWKCMFVAVADVGCGGGGGQ